MCQLISYLGGKVVFAQQGAEAPGMTCSGGGERRHQGAAAPRRTCSGGGGRRHQGAGDRGRPANVFNPHPTPESKLLSLKLFSLISFLIVFLFWGGAWAQGPQAALPRKKKIEKQTELQIR